MIRIGKYWLNPDKIVFCEYNRNDLIVHLVPTADLATGTLRFTGAQAEELEHILEALEGEATTRAFVENELAVHLRNPQW